MEDANAVEIMDAIDDLKKREAVGDMSRLAYALVNAMMQGRGRSTALRLEMVELRNMPMFP